MQRLFSTFPNSAPGTGLLALRLAVAIPLLLHSGTPIESAPAVEGIALRTAFAACGLSLIFGAWTPVAGLFAIALELSPIFRGRPFSAIHLTRTIVCAALLFLGPGAWSIDARIFGRKRLEL